MPLSDQAYRSLEGTPSLLRAPQHPAHRGNTEMSPTQFKHFWQECAQFDATSNTMWRRNTKRFSDRPTGEKTLQVSCLTVDPKPIYDQSPRAFPRPAFFPLGCRPLPERRSFGRLLIAIAFPPKINRVCGCSAIEAGGTVAATCRVERAIYFLPLDEATAADLPGVGVRLPFPQQKTGANGTSRLRIWICSGPQSWAVGCGRFK